MDVATHTRRVLVVAADPLARAGLAALLSTKAGWQVAGQLALDDALLDVPPAFDHAAVVVDLGWETGPIPEALLALIARAEPVVVLVASEGQAGAAWNVGVRAVLPRDTAPARLVAALGAAVEGLAVLDPSLAGVVRLAREGEAPPLPEGLTPRELEVLGLLAEGLPNKAIAQRLGISENTVKFHVNVILGKLGAQSRTEAVTRAARLGLILL